MQQRHRAPAASVLSARLTPVLHVLLCDVRLRLAHRRVVYARYSGLLPLRQYRRGFHPPSPYNYVLYKAQQPADFRHSLQSHEPSAAAPVTVHLTLFFTTPTGLIRGKGGSRGFGYMLHGSQHAPVAQYQSGGGRRGQILGRGGSLTNA